MYKLIALAALSAVSFVAADPIACTNICINTIGGYANSSAQCGVTPTGTFLVLCEANSTCWPVCTPTQTMTDDCVCVNITTLQPTMSPSPSPTGIAVGMSCSVDSDCVYGAVCNGAMDDYSVNGTCAIVTQTLGNLANCSTSNPIWASQCKELYVCNSTDGYGQCIAEYFYAGNGSSCDQSYDCAPGLFCDYDNTGNCIPPCSSTTCGDDKCGCSASGASQSWCSLPTPAGCSVDAYVALQAACAGQIGETFYMVPTAECAAAYSTFAPCFNTQSLNTGTPCWASFNSLFQTTPTTSTVAGGGAGGNGTTTTKSSAVVASVSSVLAVAAVAVAFFGRV